MLTPTELNNILKQVNLAFDECGARMKKLEDRVAVLEGSLAGSSSNQTLTVKEIKRK